MFVAEPDRDFPVALHRREAARVLLTDADGRVLLLKHVPPLHVLHWAGAGGGMDEGEDPEQALRRELAEELAVPAGIVLQGAGAWRHVFKYHGRPVVQHESLYHAVLPVDVAPEAVRLGPEAAEDGIAGLRWWSPAELRLTQEEVWPDGLGEWAAGLSRGHGP